MTWVLFVYLIYAVALNLALARRGLRRADGPLALRSATPRYARKVLIVGATGGTGRELVRQALDRGYVVTALVRDVARLHIQHPALTVVRGDVLDVSAVADTVRGQDAVISALGHRRYFAPTRVLSDGTRNLLRAMETHHVPRLVCETALGIGSAAGRLGVYYTLFVIPVVLPFYFWDKARQERVIEASPVEWVIVRPVTLTNTAGRGGCAFGPQVGSYVLTRGVARADVAGFMLDQVTDDRYLATAVADDAA